MTARPIHEPSLSDVLAKQLQYVGIQGWVRELKAIPGRRHRIDLAFPEARLAVEAMGGTWTNGHHTRGKGYEDDAEKACLLAINGWFYMPVTGAQIKRGQALLWIEMFLRAGK